MKQIILDTNFLLAAYQFKVDIISEIQRVCNFPYQLCVLERTLDELKNISRTAKRKDKEAIKWALTIVKNNPIKTIKEGKGSGQAHVDALLLDRAAKGAIIATQDMELKKALKKDDFTTLMIRQKKYVVIENEKIT